jgi:hypothetical protein
MGLASLGIASAKSYDIIISDATMAGATQLQPGEYKLKVEGSQAVFTDVQTSKSWTAPVKVQNSDRKFDQTVVETTHQGDMAHIDAIDLAGSNTKLAFGQ